MANNHPFFSALALIVGVVVAGLKPAEAITPSAWCEKNLIVADGPRAGDSFSLALTPYWREPLDFFSDDCPDNKEVIRKSKQVGATTLAIGAFGFTADVQPCDLFLIEPTESNLADFLSEKLQRTIDSSPTLKRRVNEQVARSGKGSTTYIKKFPGGSLLTGIATSTADLRGKTRRKVIKDETSEYPIDLGGQGSPHDMIAGAYESFLASGDWKELNISTPTILGGCHIDAEFKAGDQRYWHVECPGCRSLFYFKFLPGKTFCYSEAFPYRAHYVTECCGTVIEYHEKNELVARGRWIATKPEPGRHRSRHLDAFVSPFVPWDVIAKRWIDAKGRPEKEKTFYNLTCGLPYEVCGDAPDHVRLMALREAPPPVRRVIPPRGLLLVASADVQANAIYVEVLALAPNRESWVVEALVLDGDTSDPDAGAFAKLTQVYETEWQDSFGGRRRVDAFGVDAGFRSHVVYTWVRGRPNAFALDGRDGWARPPIGMSTLQDIDFRGRRIKQGVALWPVGTWSLKAGFYADLHKKRLEEGAPVEPLGACHFGTWLDDSYFVQLTNEYLAEEDDKKGRPRRVWKQRGPNHFLDCRIYNLALADYLGLSRMTADDWATLAKHRGVPLAGADLFAPAALALSTPSAETPPSSTVQPSADVEAVDRAPPTGGWLDGFNLKI